MCATSVLITGLFCWVRIDVTSFGHVFFLGVYFSPLTRGWQHNLVGSPWIPGDQVPPLIEVLIPDQRSRQQRCCQHAHRMYGGTRDRTRDHSQVQAQDEGGCDPRPGLCHHTVSSSIINLAIQRTSRRSAEPVLQHLFFRMSIFCNGTKVGVLAHFGTISPHASNTAVCKRALPLLQGRQVLPPQLVFRSRCRLLVAVLCRSTQCPPQTRRHSGPLHQRQTWKMTGPWPITCSRGQSRTLCGHHLGPHPDGRQRRPGSFHGLPSIVAGGKIDGCTFFGGHAREHVHCTP